jgi:hypothetical protein
MSIGKPASGLRSEEGEGGGDEWLKMGCMYADERECMGMQKVFFFRYAKNVLMPCHVMM